MNTLMILMIQASLQGFVSSYLLHFASFCLIHHPILLGLCQAPPPGPSTPLSSIRLKLHAPCLKL